MNQQQLTPLHADGAELYTLGQILLRGKTAFRAYKNQQDWDIICLSNDRKTTLTVQVKYRTDYSNPNGGILQFNNPVEFDVLVLINGGDSGNFTTHIFSQSDLEDCLTNERYLPRGVVNVEQYKDNWQVFDSINA